MKSLPLPPSKKTWAGEGVSTRHPSEILTSGVELYGATLRPYKYLCVLCGSKIIH
jgi:hypothetical protein